MSDFQCSTSPDLNPIYRVQAYFIYICSADKYQETTWYLTKLSVYFWTAYTVRGSPVNFLFYFFLLVSNIQRSDYVIGIFGNPVTITTYGKIATDYRRVLCQNTSKIGVNYGFQGRSTPS